VQITKYSDVSSAKLDKPGIVNISDIPEGSEAVWLSAIANDLAKKSGKTLLYISRDDARLRTISDGLSFFSPTTKLIVFPAWDCLPFDRVSPRADIVSQRLMALYEILTLDSNIPTIVLTTLNSALQRLPPKASIEGVYKNIIVGTDCDQESLINFLESCGYINTANVIESGEYANRGGILDIFPAGADSPIRIDFYGNEIESIKFFDPINQRSGNNIEHYLITPVAEVSLTENSIKSFKDGYREHFGAVMGPDPLFESICQGQRYPGVEHWLPLFFNTLETIFDYINTGPVILDHLVNQGVQDRCEMVADYYTARGEALKGRGLIAESLYNPLPPNLLYIEIKEWKKILASRPVGECFPFAKESYGELETLSLEIKPGINFTKSLNKDSGKNYDDLREYILNLVGKGNKVIVAAWSSGTRERLGRILRENNIGPIGIIDNISSLQSIKSNTIGLIVLPLESGFRVSGLVVIAEQDILGSRLNRSSRRRSLRAETFIMDTSEISEGDFVVHLDHGIGMYNGLVTLDVGTSPHDCLSLVYDGGDKLLLPVEHIDLLSRYGSSDKPTLLDKLGGVAWQSKKSRLKQRIKEIANELISTAAKRKLQEAPIFNFDRVSYDNFCSRFPFVETEDQLQAIKETLEDLESGSPMDRLICGDVGFGKTEVALRAAFSAVMSGSQVVVLVPTTLLCRQHFNTFFERFKGFSFQVAEISRLTPRQEAINIKEGLEKGEIHIIIGTHAVLSKEIVIPNLGLVVIDEEQHFGVSHKEKLKTLQAKTHVLTLTATPIPRTLQMSLSGVKNLSIIATPPVDRLSVRTFIMPFDPLAIREAIIREKMRGGQTFYVCPRVSDIRKIMDQLKRFVPEVTARAAHGRMSSKELEITMSQFFGGEFDVLVSTSIIESGLDIPRVNTMIIYRSDMFGLAQLYQLRGRIGRSKIRGYAYITYPPDKRLTETALKRLEVIHRLDSLGAGFSLASHDLDIRGAGNLLGSEQSGHIKEVGIELYQHLLEEAVSEAKIKQEDNQGEQKDRWSPNINIGSAILIPGDYVTDLDTRLGLYRRIGRLENREDAEILIEELTDRFGPLPSSVLNLLDVVIIKNLCLKGGIDKIDAGPKGAVIAFRNDSFPDLPALIKYVSNPKIGMRLRPDSRLIINRNWVKPEKRIKELHGILIDLCNIYKVHS
tara:strand:- start:24466 stop:27993 length:3528 start_codon:yes stop_codon:yes gene_type:complete